MIRGKHWRCLHVTLYAFIGIAVDFGANVVIYGDGNLWSSANVLSRVFPGQRDHFSLIANLDGDH